MSELIIGLLRVIHIFAGVVWVGWGLFMLSLARPTAETVGGEGGRTMYGVMKYAPVKSVFPITAGLTTLAGVLLYIMVWLFPNGEFTDVALRNAQGIVLTIGAICGLLAFGHGIPMGRMLGEYFGMLQQAGDSPTDEQVQGLQAMHAKVTRNATISAVLLVITVIAMASFSSF